MHERPFACHGPSRAGAHRSHGHPGPAPPARARTRMRACTRVRTPCGAGRHTARQGPQEAAGAALRVLVTPFRLTPPQGGWRYCVAAQKRQQATACCPRTTAIGTATPWPCTGGAPHHIDKGCTAALACMRRSLTCIAMGTHRPATARAGGVSTSPDRGPRRLCVEPPPHVTCGFTPRMTPGC